MSSFPAMFRCPITLAIMVDPVKAPDGHTYERSAIVEAIRLKGISPLTRQAMSVEQLISDYTLKSAIEDLPASNMEDNKYPPVVVSATVCTTGTVTELTLSTPDSEAAPKELVFVIDVSGSMQTEVISSTGESDGYSILDVVKHGILTCIMGLRNCDKACIVTYSTTATVVFPLRRMDAGGKGLAKVALAGIHSENSTNIWSGLQLALEQLPQGGVIFLLTDGQPNMRPPRGEVAMLKSKLDGRDDIVLNTYGFGYNLDSELLFELARVTPGSYGFHPRHWSGWHCLYSRNCQFADNGVHQYQSGYRNRRHREYGRPLSKPLGGMCYRFGPITTGQYHNIFIECDKPVRLSILDMDIVVVNRDLSNSDHQIAAAGHFEMSPIG